MMEDDAAGVRPGISTCAGSDRYHYLRDGSTGELLDPDVTRYMGGWRNLIRKACS